MRGLIRTQGRIVDPQALKHARPKIVHDDVGNLDQVMEDIPPRLGLEIDDNASLVSIEREKKSACAAVRSDRWITAQIALRRFHLDHLGAHVRQQLAAVSAGNDLAQLQYADAVKRIRHVLPSLLLFSSEETWRVRCRRVQSDWARPVRSLRFREKARQSPRPRAMMLRWTSEVPAPMTPRRESRKKRCIGYSMQ